MKNYKITTREYNGVYFVEFNSRSLGCTLKATTNKDEADAAHNHFTNMTRREMIAHLNK